MLKDVETSCNDDEIEMEVEEDDVHVHEISNLTAVDEEEDEDSSSSPVVEDVNDAYLPRSDYAEDVVIGNKDGLPDDATNVATIVATIVASNNENHPVETGDVHYAIIEEESSLIIQHSHAMMA